METLNATQQQSSNAIIYRSYLASKKS